MNYLRNFAYIRVNIGCQDPALVPSSRIGAIKKGFYVFQYTREVIDPNINPAYASAVENPEGGPQQNSPKRQRTGMQDSDEGSASAPPKFTGNNHPGSHRQNTLHIPPS
jgi:hypothetical protein